MTDARTWIAALRLTPHPEGSCYRENYRSQEAIPKEGLPARFGGARSFSTAFDFLLQPTSPAISGEFGIRFQEQRGRPVRATGRHPCRTVSPPGAGRPRCFGPGQIR
jgi:hypothetical protein